MRFFYLVTAVLVLVTGPSPTTSAQEPAQIAETLAQLVAQLESLQAEIRKLQQAVTLVNQRMDELGAAVSANPALSQLESVSKRLANAETTTTAQIKILREELAKQKREADASYLVSLRLALAAFVLAVLGLVWHTIQAYRRFFRL